MIFFKKGIPIFLLCVISIFCSCNKKGKYYFIVFNNIANLQIRDEVKLNDKIIGNVEEIKLIKSQVKVKIVIDKDLELYKNSKFVAVIGNDRKSYIKVISPPNPESIISPGTTVFGINENDNEFKL